MGNLTTGTEGDGQGWPESQRKLQSASFFQLFIAINVIALYGYLFWDSISTQVPALVGGSADVLFLKDDRFMDWVNTLRSAGLSLPYGLQGQVAMPVYPPFTYALLRPLATLLVSSASDVELAKLAWIGVTAIVLLAVCRNVERLRFALHPQPSGKAPLQLLIIVLVSYPFLFAFDRGNLELVTFALISWFAVRQLSPGSDHSSLGGSQSLVRSSLILAVAAAIKPYTFLFVCLSAVAPASGSRRQRVERLLRLSLCSFAFVLLLSLISLLWLYQGDLAQGISDYRHWQQLFMVNYIVGGVGDQFFSSPYVAIKMDLLKLGAPASAMLGFIRIYPLVSLAVSVAVLFKTFRLRQADPVVMLTAICFCLLVFPYNANEYKAVYLLLPFLVFYQSTDHSYNLHPAAEDFSGAKAPSNTGALSPWRWSPTAVSITLCFGLLLNRYGLTGDRLLASLIASVLLMVFPVLFLLSREEQSLPGEIRNGRISGS